MARILKTTYATKAGLPPGTARFVGEQRVERTTISIIDYDQQHFEEHHDVAPESCARHLQTSTVTWINVIGLHDEVVLAKLADIFQVHPLILEDIVNVGQRPKVEEHDSRLFAVIKMVYNPEEISEIVSEQVSLLVGNNYVVSFQELEGDVFDHVRERIRSSVGLVRHSGSDYLAYTLLDAVVDNYFIVLEKLGDAIEGLHSEVIRDADPTSLQAIHRLRGEMIYTRKVLWPTRELVSDLLKSESPLIQAETRPYLRDVYEHTIQVIDTMESLRDLLSSALDIYLTTVSNKMNDVMRVLTVIATIFIPLTFIAGIYGMNFRHMPELEWPIGYPVVWAIMLAVAGGMMVFFKRKGWF